MKYLIMCEGPNELEIIKMLLEQDEMILDSDDLLNLVPFHARQIGSNAAVRAALNIYHGELKVLRIGDKLSDELKIPKLYKEQIIDVKKYFISFPKAKTSTGIYLPLFQPQPFLHINLI